MRLLPIMVCENIDKTALLLKWVKIAQNYRPISMHFVFLRKERSKKTGNEKRLGHATYS